MRTSRPRSPFNVTLKGDFVLTSSSKIGSGTVVSDRLLSVIDGTSISPLSKSSPVYEKSPLREPNVITSNTSPLFEIAEGSASLVDPLNVHQLADAIVTALTDEALRQQLVTAGHTRAAQFSWKQTAEQTLQVYQAAMQGDPPAGVAT